MAKIFNAAQNPTLTNNSGNCLPDCNGGDRKMNESLKTEFCVVGGGLAVTRWAASSSLDAPRGPASLRDFPLMMAAVLDMSPESFCSMLIRTKVRKLGSSHDFYIAESFR